MPAPSGGRLAGGLAGAEVEVELSVSPGVVVADLDDGPAAALARADDAMYERKRSSG